MIPTYPQKINKLSWKRSQQCTQQQNWNYRKDFVMPISIQCSYWLAIDVIGSIHPPLAIHLWGRQVNHEHRKSYELLAKTHGDHNRKQSTLPGNLPNEYFWKICQNRPKTSKHQSAACFSSWGLIRPKMGLGWSTDTMALPPSEITFAPVPSRKQRHRWAHLRRAPVDFAFEIGNLIHHWVC